MTMHTKGARCHPIWCFERHVSFLVG